MKLALALLILALPVMGSSQDRPVIASQQAAGHSGETAFVEELVSAVSKSNKGNISLNFGGKHPDHIFTADASSTARLDLGNLNSLDGKRVCVFGKVRNHKGKPEIMVNNRSQIEP